MRVGLIAQHGPMPGLHERTVLAMDGTTTPACVDPTEEKQRLMKGNKGHAWNHVLMVRHSCVWGGVMGIVSAPASRSSSSAAPLLPTTQFDMFGRVCDYTLAHYGTMNDERASVPLIERHRSAVTNPHRLGLILDNGWKTREIFHDGSGDRPQVVRALAGGDVYDEDDADYVLRCSASVTVARQFNEHNNGGLKRCFPILQNPVRMDDREIIRRDMEICIRMYNMRTRLVGYNQSQTAYLRHTDEDFRETLKAHTVEEYVALNAQRVADLRAA